jgi:aquaporin Z
MKLSKSQRIFFAELIGTFVLVVCATGSVVINAKSSGTIGLWFEAFAPFAALSILVPLFGKISMAHFNPAITIMFLITRHMPAKLLPVYLGAEFVGAFLASVFVSIMIGTNANLGANVPNYQYPLATIYGIEILATVILAAVILVVVYNKGLKGLGGLAIGGAVFFDIFFLSQFSGASMNPIRSLAPAVLSGSVDDLWLYWSAPFVGAIIVAVFRRKIKKTI